MNEKNQLTDQTQKSPWYKTWWGILLIIFFFPILVPILVWTKTNWNIAVKIVITIICGFFFLAGISDNSSQINQETKPSQEKNEMEINKKNNEVKDETNNSQENDNQDIGKIYCNKTNNECKGTIIKIKTCNTDPSQQCFVVDMGENYNQPVEHPISNGYAKDKDNQIDDSDEDLKISKEKFTYYDQLFKQVSSLHEEYISIKDEVRQAQILREIRNIENPKFNNNMSPGEKELLFPINDYIASVSYLRYRNGKYEGIDFANEKKEEILRAINSVKNYNNL
ncbi:MAG: hypothetical protein GF347_01795 [Candidatus Moranbacteria bacterium]|nr:hypothetical protein [Candidatus Moranbacteria bacterium]